MVKLSKFSVKVPSTIHRGYQIVYSTLFDKAALVSDDFLDSLQGNDLPSYASEEEIFMLKDLGIVVDSSENEDDVFYYYLNKSKFSKRMFIDVLTTLSCNFACKYCYQDELHALRNAPSMTTETCKAVVRWLDHHVQYTPCDEMLLTFTGGETLLNIPALNILVPDILNVIENNNIKLLGFSVSTNGLLLTKKTVKLLNKLGIRGVGISLDGDKDTHDYRRPTREGMGTFDRILTNLYDAACELDYVVVLVTVDAHNVDKALSVLDTLKTMGVAKRKIRVHFRYTKPSLQGETEWSQFILNPRETAITYANLLSGAKKKGVDFGTKERGPRALYSCQLEKPGSLRIDPEGNLFVCSEMVGLQEAIVGTVFDMDFAELSFRRAKFAGIEIWRNNQGCKTCPYLPPCRGGCSFESFIRSGRFDKFVQCQKPFFDELYPRLLPLFYEA